MQPSDDEVTGERQVVDGARLLAGVGAAFYAVVALALFTGIGGGVNERWLAGHVSVSVLVLGFAWIAMRRSGVETLYGANRRMLIPLGLLVISNPVAFMVAEQTAYPSIGMTIVILGVAALLHDRRTVLVLVAATNVAWLGAAASYGIGGIDTGVFVAELAMTNIVACLLHVTRASTVRRLESARRQVERLARTDSLTGVGNQRQVEEVGPLLHRRARSSGLLSVVFVDLDELKAVNDAHGHAAGDRLIKSVAETLKCTVREDDLVARVGGDEFVVLCTDVDEDGAAMFTQRLRGNLARAGHAVSIGIASATAAPDERIEHVIARADAAMYADKQARRAAGGVARANGVVATP